MPDPLLAYLSGAFSPDDPAALAALGGELAATQVWSAGPPEFIDELDDASSTQPGDQPIRTVGLLLPTEGGTDGSSASAEDVSRFVAALSRFSQERGLELELQLGSIYAGEIRAGQPDRLVREGLLGGW